MIRHRIFIFLSALILFFPQGARARYHPGITWRVVRTDRFIVYYPAGHETFAARVLSLAGEVHSDVSGYFGVSPRPIPLVLHPGTDRFNGFYTLFPNRISLFETPVDELKTIGGATNDLMDMVFTHEYTHYVHITSTRGIYKIIQRLFGRDLGIGNIISPGWAIEGITTNLETRFTEGGRGRSPYFSGLMRSLTQRKRFWSLSAAGTPSPYAPVFGRFYLTGYYMIEYLNRTYGCDAFAHMTAHQAGLPFRGTGRALRKVTKKKPRFYFREFVADYTARNDSIGKAVGACGLPVGKTLVSETLDGFVSHAWTKRNTIAALRKGFGKPNAVVEIDPVTGDTIEETKTGNILQYSQVRFLGDGRLVFGETFYHPLGEGELDTGDLVVFDPKTRKRERVTHGAHVFSADLSPDGTVFAGVRRRGMWTDLVRIDRDGSSVETILSMPGLYVESPVWSPDGGTIAVTVKAGRNNGIALVDPGSGEAVTLFAPDVNGIGDPEFSPDGEWLVFSSDMSGVWNIYAFHITCRRLYRLTSVYTAATEPRISPDGGTVSFLVLSNGVNEIHVLPFEPRDGLPIDFAAGGPLGKPDIDTSRTSIVQETVSAPPLSAYVPFIHMPYVQAERDGLSYGAFVMGGDPVGLNTYGVSAFYESGTERLGYDAILFNKSFWPLLMLRAYDSDREGKALNGSDESWYRERGGEVSLGLPVIHRAVPDVLASYFETGVRFRRFSDHEDRRIDSSRMRSISIIASAFVDRIPDNALRDTVPSWGQSLYLAREEGLDALGGRMPGHIMEVVFRQYLPSPLRYHGFELTVEHQSQSGSLIYNGDPYVPRGYSSGDTDGGLNLRKKMTVSAEYRFPLAFVDRGVGVNLIHLNLVRGSLFVDHGAGWDNSFDASEWGRRAQTSLGGTLSAQTYLFSFVPLEIGVMAGYMPGSRISFTGIVLDVWGAGFADRYGKKRRLSILPGL